MGAYKAMKAEKGGEETDGEEECGGKKEDED